MGGRSGGGAQLVLRRHHEEDLLERALRHRALLHVVHLLGLRQPAKEGGKRGGVRRHGERHHGRLELLDGRCAAAALLQEGEHVFGVRLLKVEAQVEFVAVAIFGLETLDRAEAAEGAVDHDSDTAAEGLALLHRVRREDDGPDGALPRDNVPHVAAGDGVHAGGGLIEEHELRRADERDADAQLALVAARVLAGGLVGKLSEVEIGDEAVHLSLDQVWRHLLDGRVHAQRLAARHQPLEGVVLRAVADEAADGVLFGEDGHAVEEGVARGGRRRTGEHREGCRLAGAVDAEEAEALARLDAQAEVAHRHLAADAAVDLAKVLEDQLAGRVAAINGGALCDDGVVFE
mmetsp:Transcript_29514/g.81021  ORF Transcript_29514/g.81021 Transcript_29514/m.81021 type:complete len:347 (+) Transcript_29514:900-1940(+)